MREPLVSIITPTYNQGRYIARCIKSLLAQTYREWELIIVDDGSTDNTADIVKSFEDSRINYTYQQNRGVGQLATTINDGLKRTTGELVTMFASDDLWPPYRLRVQVSVFEDPAVVLCFGWGWLIDENDNVLGVAHPTVRDPASLKNRPVGSALRKLFLANFIPQYTVLIRRSALEQIGGYLQPPGLLAEDYPTHMALALIGEFRYLNLGLGCYRMHPKQMTRNYYLQMVQSDIAYVIQFFRGLDSEMQERTSWSEHSLARALSERLHNTYFEIGRRDLLARDWKSAKGHLLVAIARGNSRTKIKAAAGLVCSLLHLDMEGLARFAGNTPLR